ncbi:MAG: DUF4878 domain-containing protein [Bacteroidales bacterium]|nr:DUF4878 domain-containing protein [Bacteroidales bacterium]
MKKIAMIAMVALLGCSLALVSCGGGAAKGDSPSDVVKKALTCAINEDYEGMVQYYDGVDMSDEQEIKEAAAWMQLLYSISGGLENFEVKSETIADDGLTATVEVTLTTKGGDTKDSAGKVVKTDNGWKLSLK